LAIGSVESLREFVFESSIWKSVFESHRREITAGKSALDDRWMMKVGDRARPRAGLSGRTMSGRVGPGFLFNLKAGPVT